MKPLLTALPLVLAVLSPHAGQQAACAFAGTSRLASDWIGGVEQGDDLILTKLLLLPDSTGWQTTLLRMDGSLQPSTHSHALPATADSIAFADLGGRVALACGDGVLAGTWTNGSSSLRATWRSLASVAPGALDAAAGHYLTPEGRSFHVVNVANTFLRTYDVSAARFQNWYPSEPGGYLAGPDFERSWPATSRLQTSRGALEITNLASAGAIRMRRVEAPRVAYQLHVAGDDATLVRNGDTWSRLRLVPAGTFTMGTTETFARVVAALGIPASQAAQRQHDSAFLRTFLPPARAVRIAKPLWIGMHEVTHREFSDFVAATGYMTVAEQMGWGMRWDGARFVRATGRSWRRPGYPVADDLPVTMVTWTDAVAYVEWLTRESGRRVRLPSEAEWEYVAKGGGTALFGSVAELGALRAHAWFGAGTDSTRWRPHPVGTKQPNAFGVHDMLGNVWEWTSELFSPRPDDPGAATGSRVIRGGSWLNDATSLLPFYRGNDSPTLVEPHFGFRIAVDVSARERATPRQ